ncbi:hypothetical protein HG15A2_37640 [Adhaeretor mobilis]|uniref:Uncharacterized protein n=1 Tax=Adhaeretor mobilis TaxID=1930276 RepID=A0A517MZW7_9BACT|nr:hypothetical protein HG15A2_37640 [Adhaeretor mobilis]
MQRHRTGSVRMFFKNFAASVKVSHIPSPPSLLCLDHMMGKKAGVNSRNHKREGDYKRNSTVRDWWGLLFLIASSIALGILHGMSRK